MSAPFDVANAEVLVIGAGPAGLAAATRLKSLGVRNVIVVDREQQAGGIPRHCGHPPFGMREFGRVLTGPVYARRLSERAQRAGVELLLGCSVVGIDHAGGIVVTCTSSRGPAEIRAERVILATGVREMSRAARLISGDRPLGVLNTGALQSYAYLQHMAPFRRPIIVGTELVALSSLLTCRKIGAAPVAMIEDRDRPTVRRISMLLPHLLGVPVRYGTHVADIKGKQRVEAVTLRRADGTLEEMECDGVLLTGRFMPDATLARAAGLEIDRGTGGPMIDQFGRTSEPLIFAAGNVLHPVETAGWSWREGRRIAEFVAADLAGQLPAVTRTVKLTPGEGVRYVVPQRLVPEKGGLAYLQLRVADDVSGALTARCRGQLIMTQPLTSAPERRILSPISAFDRADGEVVFSFDDNQSATSRSDATCV